VFLRIVTISEYKRLNNENIKNGWIYARNEKMASRTNNIKTFY